MLVLTSTAKKYAGTLGVPLEGTHRVGNFCGRIKGVNYHFALKDAEGGKRQVESVSRGTLAAPLMPSKGPLPLPCFSPVPAPALASFPGQYLAPRGY